MYRKSFRPSRRRPVGDNHGFARYQNIIDRAKAMLRDNLPLPVDMQMRLLEIGVDVEGLEVTYG